MNKKDLKRNYWMLNGKFARQGYDWWWHNFTAVDAETGEEKPFFIEFFTCNPEKGGDINPVLGQLPENQKNGNVPSYLMVKCGWWGNDATQLHRFIAWNDVEIKNGKKIVHKRVNEPAEEKLNSFAEDGYSVKAFDCYASDSNLRGKVEISKDDVEKHPEWMCNSGSMEWNLEIKKDVAFNVGYGAGSLFRALKAFQMYWHAEGMKSLYSGEIIANGRKYVVKPETCFGYSDKNWGEDFTSPWVWISSNDLVSKKTGQRLKNSVFDIGGGRPKAFGIAMNRKLLSDFWYEGKSYEFNFSKFWTFCRTKFDCKETESEIHWYVRQETVKAVMETELTCPKNKMLLVNYEAPNGKKLHNRLWNGGHGEGTVKLYAKSKGKLQLLDEMEFKHAGCEWGEYCEPTV